MAVVGVLMNVHYRKGFHNLVVVPRKDVKLGITRKYVPKMPLPLGPRTSYKTDSSNVA